MDKITYLLGAGASMEALPLAKDLAKELLTFSEAKLSEKVKGLFGPNDPGANAPKNAVWPKGPIGKKLMQSFEWLGAEAGRHASVDTYAKKLFIRNDDESKEALHKLKVTLSCYLLLQQALMPTDKRYDSFFASILNPCSEGKPSWPEGVNVVTWNYDTQLEKSYREFCSDPSMVHEGVTEAPNIRRLNGICGVPNDLGMRELGYRSFDKAYFENILNLYDAQMNRSQAVVPSISFAWEKTEGVENETLKLVSGTSTLVIVGYSFPYFNREIDEVLLLSMMDFVPSLQKIYIQVPRIEQGAIQDRLLTLFDNPDVREEVKRKIKPVNTGLFFIPDNMPR